MILATNNASLSVNGALSSDQELLENDVIFEGDRLDPGFADIPGQWGTIYLFNGSVNNTINYATIKNATIGVLSEGNQNAAQDNLTVTNTQIYNSSNYGILGRATSIKAENVVINNSGLSSFAGTLGGKYNFIQSTIANYWSNNFREFPSLLINDFTLDENNAVVTNDLIEANFNNCIIYGNMRTEVILENEGDVFNFKFNNSLIRFDNSDLEGTGNYDFTNTTFYVDNVFNELPVFADTHCNLRRIGGNSGAGGIGNICIGVPGDIVGVTGTNPPSEGAYQRVNFEESFP